MWAGVAPPEASLPGLSTAVFSLCPHTTFPLCVCVLFSSSYKDTNQIGLGSPLKTSF